MKDGNTINWNILNGDAPARSDVPDWQRAARLQEPFRRATTPASWDWWRDLVFMNDTATVLKLIEMLRRAHRVAGGESTHMDWLTKLRLVMERETRLDRIELALLSRAHESE